MDFKLYSTLQESMEPRMNVARCPLPQDALADNNAWDYCAFDGALQSSVQFPGLQVRSLEYAYRQSDTQTCHLNMA